jgi:3-hydroxy-9,10-secoandrosta-1,3,5(10)-triene-9,17-dione monooxygenase reductase component
VSSVVTFEERHFRNVLGHFATGVAVVTAIDGDTLAGMTVQSFCSLSLDPPLIVVCPGLSSTSWPRIERAGRLCVNLLAEGQERLARQFSKPGIDKYEGVGWTPAPHTGSPVIEGALAWIDCTAERAYSGGDHLIVVCRVHALSARTDRRPLIFFQSGFQRMEPTVPRGAHADDPDDR